ncbi:Bridging integrator 3 [Lamellibrachia satsuma]|nr:Bridging integrator 3 [Lamellibrachia satsuma]
MSTFRYNPNQSHSSPLEENPFNRHHVPKKSAISRTEEREFERDVKKLELLDENTKKVYKDTKRCIESQTAQNKSEVKMVQDLANSPLVREEETLQPLVEQWSSTATKLEQLTNELNTNYYKTVVEPMKKFSTIVPSTQAAVKKRDQSLQEYSRYLAKVEKYREKERTGPNVVKLDAARKALLMAKDDFQTQNSILTGELPRFYDHRIDYVQPCFQALIKSQVKYYTDARNIYTDLSRRLGGEKDDLPSDVYNQRIQQKLTEIRALSITLDD